MRLTELVQQNPWWRYEDKFPNKDVDLGRISFLLKKKLIEITPKNIYIIRGIRRCGENRLLKNLNQKFVRRKYRP